jgi:hypothetical protein
MPTLKRTKSGNGPHGNLPDFVFLLRRIEHFLGDPENASAEDLKVAREALGTIIKTIYCESCMRACVSEPPRINHGG